MKYAPPFHRTNGLVPVIIALATLIVLPLIFTDTYVRHILILVFIYAILASNWDLSLGYGGVFNFAHMAFFAIGLYAYGIGAKIIGIDPWLTILLAPLASMAFAALLAAPILRLEGIYVILVTIAASQLLLKIVVSQSDITGGTSGMVLLPRLTIGDYRLTSDGRIGYYYVALLLLAASTVFLYKLERSSVGRAIKALRDNKYYAISRGVSEGATRLYTLCASAVLPGLAGAFYGSYVRVASPDVFGLSFLTITLSILLVGGVSTIWGPIIAAFAITVFAELLGEYGAWRDIIVACVIIGVVVIYPGGLFAGIQELWDALDSRKAALIALWRRRFQAGRRSELMGGPDRMVETSHGRIAVFDNGNSGQALLFIHGNSACKEAFFRQVAAFGDRYRIVAFDLPGHGVSENGNPRTDYNYEAYARVAAEIVEKLSLGTPIVFGWSLGGYVALEYAAAGNPTRALAICGTSPLGTFPDDMPLGYIASPHMELAGKRFFSWYEKRIYAAKTVPAEDAQAQLVRHAVWRTDGRAREQVVARMKTVDWPRQIRLMKEGTVPFAMINGPEDPFINHDYCAGFPYGNIWRGKTQNIAGGGHAPFLAAAAAFNAAFAEFLAEFETLKPATQSELATPD
ncbi:alpha/beta fold hydrolase [Hoeflea poritis]|uniref:Alpha/beta fold hydrolase n=1 Tax=Hoeflea poritis TaxID=2993659 RepID=A0ABT4VNY0_9HYPH|nr:alpha/beta fold hydrolase [Hoeflea poritis]MDA4846386.1 alpha/beta fold hydrolase [Hoeflea poritis]